MQDCFKSKLNRKESLRLKETMIMMAIMTANNNYVNKYNMKNNSAREIANESHPFLVFVRQRVRTPVGDHLY